MTRWIRSVRLLVAVLLMIVISRPTTASCANQDWSHSLGTPEHGAIYGGTVGDKPIRMMLHLDVKSGAIDGMYGYSNQPGILLLTGRLRPNGAGADLDERDSSGQVTGHFSLDFVEHLEPGQNPEILKKYPQKCDAPIGTWYATSSGNALKLNLHRNGEWVPGYDVEETMDEATAVKLRNAILQKNRKAFAALLKYPFYRVTYPETYKKWSTPQDVIQHYDEIVTISLEDVRDSVPHVLGANSMGANFLYDSVFLSNGKVKMICEGRCPVAAYFDVNLLKQ